MATHTAVSRWRGVNELTLSMLIYENSKFD